MNRNRSSKYFKSCSGKEEKGERGTKKGKHLGTGENVSEKNRGVDT